MSRLVLPVVVALLSGLLVMAGLSLSFAHDAPKGWSYPFSCCSDFDCRAVDAGAIEERPEGYVIRATGEVVPMADPRVKPSPDGDFHWCSVGGKPDGRTLCLFVPPRSY